MNSKRHLLILLLIFSLASHLEAKVKNGIIPGLLQTDLYFPLLKGKVIGVVTNQTSVIGRVHLVDSLKSAGFSVKNVFAPEHGFRGDKGAGESVPNQIDQRTGLPVISLYGNHVRPESKDLKGIEVMIFDIQDVGVRFYTYLSTLQYVMEACAENNIALIVLDRPNPNGFYIDGPVLESEYSSFVGLQPVPVVYGMTIGEYASMLNGEGWLKNKMKCNLKIVPLKNYNRNLISQLLRPPSPNLPDMDAILLYPSLCFFEGTKISVGRGTNKPFRLIGYPQKSIDGISFTPENIPGVAANPPYQDTLCVGRDLTGEGRNFAESKKIQLKLLIEMYSQYPEKEKFFSSFFDKLAGTAKLRKQIIENKSEEEIRKSWEVGINHFKEIRKKYLKYEDFK